MDLQEDSRQQPQEQRWERGTKRPHPQLERQRQKENVTDLVWQNVSWCHTLPFLRQYKPQPRIKRAKEENVHIERIRERILSYETQTSAAIEDPRKIVQVLPAFEPFIIVLSGEWWASCNQRIATIRKDDQLIHIGRKQQPRGTIAAERQLEWKKALKTFWILKQCIALFSNHDCEN